MFRFLHTADWQVGKPYRHIQDETKRAVLQRERLAVIHRIAALAKEHQVDAVLVAGDLFDSPTPTSGVLLEVLEAIGAMDVPVLVIPGNHDMLEKNTDRLDPLTPFLSDIDRVHYLKKSGVYHCSSNNISFVVSSLPQGAAA